MAQFVVIDILDGETHGRVGSAGNTNTEWKWTTSSSLLLFILFDLTSALSHTSWFLFLSFFSSPLLCSRLPPYLFIIVSSSFLFEPCLNLTSKSSSLSPFFYSFQQITTRLCWVAFTVIYSDAFWSKSAVSGALNCCVHHEGHPVAHRVAQR